MADEMEEFIPNFSLGSVDELMGLVFDDEFPFFVLPQVIEPEPRPSPEPVINLLAATVDSRDIPTMEADTGTLSFTNTVHESNICNNHTISQARSSILEKELNKIENKYTLKVNGSGNGMTDDGYKWRKYGQKSIKNNPFPRSYYRCTNPRCSAKKQVEKSSDESDTFLVTYEGLHLHFAFSHLFPRQPHDTSFPIIKKQKKPIFEAQDSVTQQAPESPIPVIASTPTSGPEQMLVGAETSPQGLLEDVVPFLIRRPPNSLPNSTSSSSSHPSSPLSPSTSSSSSSSSSFSFSWSPAYSSFIDVGMR